MPIGLIFLIQYLRRWRHCNGSLHYHPQPSPDGNWIAYGSLRDGARNIYVMNLADRTEKRLTDLKPGHAAMWPHWQPRSKAVAKK